MWKMTPDQQLICEAKENLRLIEKALIEKRPDEYQSIEELHAALSYLLSMFSRVEVNGAKCVRCTMRAEEMEKYHHVLRENEPK